MNKRKVYIIVSILIAVLLGGLLAWTLFIGRAQQQLETPTTDLGYFDTGGTSGGGGILGGVFGSDGFTIEKDDEETNSSRAQLQQLYNLPQAGAAVLTSGEDVLTRFVDRATGHVFEKNVNGDNSRRILQTTVPRVYEALFTENSDGVIRRYLDEEGAVISVYDNLREQSGGPSTLLDHNIRHMSVAPDGSTLAYISEDALGARAVITEPNGENIRFVWESGLRGWLPSWVNEERITLLQKPSADIPGSLYTITIADQREEATLSQIRGLTTRSSDRFVLYSRVAEGNPTLWVYDTQTKNSRNLNVATIADKCVWSTLDTSAVYCALPDAFPEGAYPDAWYQGRVHFSDSFWRINVETGALQEIIAPSRTHSVSLDAVDLLLDDEETHLIFTNQTDLTLWSITFTQQDTQ